MGAMCGALEWRAWADGLGLVVLVLLFVGVASSLSGSGFWPSMTLHAF